MCLKNTEGKREKKNNRSSTKLSRGGETNLRLSEGANVTNEPLKKKGKMVENEIVT